jgi:HSP20 family molecular chaperone IbpA
MSQEQERVDQNAAMPNTKDVGLSDFLAEVTGAARELTSSIRGSVTRAINQNVKTFGTGNYPLLDMYETSKAVILQTAPIDTYAPPIVEVSMTGEMLTIKVTTQGTTEVAEDTYLYRERRFGEFTRAIQIPRAVKAQEAKARFKNGILTITLPKIQDSGANIISVQMGE